MLFSKNFFAWVPVGFNNSIFLIFKRLNYMINSGKWIDHECLCFSHKHLMKNTRIQEVNNQIDNSLFIIFLCFKQGIKALQKFKFPIYYVNLNNLVFDERIRF